MAEQQFGISNDSLQQCAIIQQKGNYFFQQKMFDSAQYYTLIGLKLARAINDEYSILSSLNDVAINYKNLGENELALLYIDSALNFFKHKEEMYESYCSMLNNKASIHAQIGNFATAKAIFEESIKYALLCSNRYMEMENYLNLSQMYEKINDYKLTSYYLKKYYSLKDSLYSIESQNKINDLESDYKIEKKNLEIIKKDSAIRSQKSKNRIYSILIFAACSLLTMLYFNFKRIEKKKKQVEEKNNLISLQKDDLENLNHVKDRLFSIISHDLRNPLNTLRSYLMLSDNESITADKKLLFKNQTISAVAQTGNLLDNLLTWANMQLKNTIPKKVPISIVECIQDVIDTVKPQSVQKNININLQMEDTVVITDIDILSIALRNILTNSIKFSNEHSAIMITSHIVDHKLQLMIQDFGVGMSKDQIDQIFQKSNQTTLGTKGEKGSGLGLFLVMELLQKIETPLTIQSELGKGSTFILLLNKM